MSSGVLADTPLVGTTEVTPSATQPATSVASTATASSTPTEAPTQTQGPTAMPTASARPSATQTGTATPTPGPTPDGVARELHVPILMYHYVSEPPVNANIYRRDLSVTPERFESHLEYLREAGYQTITLDDLLYALSQGSPLPERAVILTFDDGYEDNYTNAFPLLTRYDMVAHFFIMTDVVNSNTPGYMTWTEIEEMAAAGQRFGSHARDHSQRLAGKTVDFLVWHALGGLEAIREHLGYHPRWIAYPSGEYDARAIAVYKSANYWGGLSIRPGATHTLADIFELKRVRVRGSHTAEDLARLLALDW